MNTVIHVKIQDQVLTVPRGTKVFNLPLAKEASSLPIVAAHVDHKLVSLHYPLLHDAAVEPITFEHPDGHRVYERSVTFLMTFAVHSLFPDLRILALHPYHRGIYCEAADQREISTTMLQEIHRKMKEVVAEDFPIVPEDVDEDTAMRLFSEIPSREDAVRLFRRFPEHHHVTIYRAGDYFDYSAIPLVPRTGLLDQFHLVPYPPGFVILLPERLPPYQISTLLPQPKLFSTFELSSRWARILGVQDAGSLNEVIATADISDFIKIAEALHEKRIAQIADEITHADPPVKLVFIAGPSSSGKTTFAKRLAIQLRVNERRPVAISLDNYFVDREFTPKDEEGQYDFDSIEAVDLPLLNEHLEALMEGKEIEVPKFSFKRGKRVFSGGKLRLGPYQILLLEGLHALHPAIAKRIPKGQVYRIYVSALTQIRIDAHNRISTSDTRLIRRLVRDRFFRGHDAETTLRMWRNVRKGEERFIFPYQEQADVMFNSALVYELAVLKVYAEPLLENVPPTVPEYADAVRLLGLLAHFLPLFPDEVPPTSILREFIGGSSFRY